ncbi:MAG: hypothetical protein ACXV9T_08845 [Methylobacter sp.]
MTNKAKQPSEWMPVFVALEPMQTISSIGSEDEQVRPSEEKIKTVWQRIGTAFSRPDGGWEILVNVVPLNGRLTIRPPQPGEERNAIPRLWR